MPECPSARRARCNEAWGFSYKSNIVWHKIRKDGGSDGRGVGFYFRNVTETILFGVRGKNARTLKPGRTQVNYLATRKREHSRKPDEQYSIINRAHPVRVWSYLHVVNGTIGLVEGNQADEHYHPTWNTYPNHSGRPIQILAEVRPDPVKTVTRAIGCARLRRDDDEGGPPLRLERRRNPSHRCAHRR